MKRQYKKTFFITSQAIHSNSPVLAGSLLHLWNRYCIYIFLQHLTHFGYSSENLPHLPPLLSCHVTTLFLFAHAVYIHYILPKCLKKASFGKWISRRSKTSLKYFFSVSTITSMCAVLCSVIVSERLKMRKSLAINYWQDTIFLVSSSIVMLEISITFKEFQLVLQFWTVSHFNTIFSIHKNTSSQKPGELQPPPTPRFLRAWVE